jgi:CBS domain-containing protein
LTAPPEVADFLGAHPPFDTLYRDTVERVAASAEVEFHPAGSTIISQGAAPAEHLRVVRSGAVEITYHGRVLDLLTPGELFGHASMLSGLPVGFAARAAEDTLCYRIPATDARGLLGRPEGLKFVARSLLDDPTTHAAAMTASALVRDPADQPIGALIHGEPVVCEPTTSIQEAAQMMTRAGVSSIVIELGDREVGILTDRDLRTKVVADGISGAEPVSAAMTAPA